MQALYFAHVFRFHSSAAYLLGDTVHVFFKKDTTKDWNIDAYHMFLNLKRIQYEGKTI